MAHHKGWNWQQAAWPKFTYDLSLLEARERLFWEASGHLLGLSQHVEEREHVQLLVEALSEEALKTSEIEGEFLNRDSVQSSLQRRFGLVSDGRRIPPAEDGIADLLIDLFKNFKQALSHDLLFKWHAMLMKGRRDLEVAGAYRHHSEPMLIVSGRIDHPKIHFEAPPSSRIAEEMDRFINWYADSSPNGKAPLPALVRAALVHLYFVSIHPFEDGNGRLARALVTRSLAENLGRFSLIALSETILKDRKTYYQKLEFNNKTLEVQDWLDYFSTIILSAQNRSIEALHFLIKKTRFFDHYRNNLNARQSKLLERVLREGVDGFQGSISAEKYISITGASRATATRDLTELVAMGVLVRSGTGKGTRYQIVLP